MDLPFLWTPPANGNAYASVLSDDASLSRDKPFYHGLEGNHHLQQPYVYERVFTREQCERIKAIGRSLPVLKWPTSELIEAIENVTSPVSSAGTRKAAPL